MTLEELTAEVESGAIDTIVVAFTDMQGRLMGKRVHGQFFLEGDVAGHGLEGCNYLLALDMEMDPIPGYQMANWEQGYGDFVLQPDLGTLRRIPRWLGALGMLAAASVIAGALVPLLGHATIMALFMPMGVSQLLLIGWLLWRGFATPAARTEVPA